MKNPKEKFEAEPLFLKIDDPARRTVSGANRILADIFPPSCCLRRPLFSLPPSLSLSLFLGLLVDNPAYRSNRISLSRIFIYKHQTRDLLCMIPLLARYTIVKHLSAFNDSRGILMITTREFHYTLFVDRT